MNLALKDEYVRKEIIDFIPNGIKAAFENDILKSTHDFAVAIVDKGLISFKSEANNYLKGLSSSQHKNYEPAYSTLFDTLKTREHRFDFINLIERSKETRRALIHFGKLLIKNYESTQLTESEHLVIKEIQELEKQQIIDDEESIKKAEELKAKREEQKRKIKELK